MLYGPAGRLLTVMVAAAGESHTSSMNSSSSEPVGVTTPLGSDVEPSNMKPPGVSVSVTPVAAPAVFKSGTFGVRSVVMLFHTPLCPAAAPYALLGGGAETPPLEKSTLYCAPAVAANNPIAAAHAAERNFAPMLPPPKK